MLPLVPVTREITVSVDVMVHGVLATVFRVTRKVPTPLVRVESALGAGTEPAYRFATRLLTSRAVTAKLTGEPALRAMATGWTRKCVARPAAASTVHVKFCRDVETPFWTEAVIVYRPGRLV